MRRSSDRGATEPLAALVAVATVCGALGLYAGVLPLPAPTDERAAAADRLLDAAYDATSEAGVVDPDALGEVSHGRWRINVTVRSGERSWHSGPTPPSDAVSASRRVSVRHGPGQVRPGRIEVVVW